MGLGFQHLLAIHRADAVHHHGAAIDFAHRGGGHHGVADPHRGLEHDAGGQEDRTVARQLGAQQGRNEPDAEGAMRHPAPEHRPAREFLIEMHRIHVAGGLAEQLDVALGDGMFRRGGHAGLQLIEINAGHCLSPYQTSLRVALPAAAPKRVNRAARCSSV